MHPRSFWRYAQSLLLVAALVVAVASLASSLSASLMSVALADIVAGKNDNNRAKNKGNDNDEDHQLRGQVLSIDKDKRPPEMIVADIDGKVLVRVLKTDEIDKNGVRPGDHVHLEGEKINELLFEATNIDVTRRCCPSPDNDNR